MKSCFAFFHSCCAFMILYILVVIGYGIFSYYSNKDNILRNTDEKLALVAAGVKRVLPKDFHDRAVSANAVSEEEDRKNVLLLSEYAKKTNVMAVYTAVEDHGSFYMTASSKSASERALSPLTPYFLPAGEEAVNFATVLSGNTPLYLNKSTKWGKVRTVLMPEHSPGGHIYIAGADINAGEIDRKIKNCLFSSLGISSLFILMAIPFVILFRKGEKERISEYKDLKDMLHQRSMDRTTKIERKIDELINKK